jgi:hypothetical protein
MATDNSMFLFIVKLIGTILIASKVYQTWLIGEFSLGSSYIRECVCYIYIIGNLYTIHLTIQDTFPDKMMTRQN